MAKTKLSEYDANAANNLDIDSINLSENVMVPSDVNNALRELMAHLKDFSDGTEAVTSPQMGSLTVTGDVTVDTDTLYVDSTNNRVGIGTTSPSDKFSVKSATGEAGFQAGTSVSPERGNLWYDTDGSGWKFNIGKLQSGTFTPQMTLQDDGNVGIASTSPQSVLDLGDGTAGTGIVWGGPTGTAHYNSIWSEYGTASIVIGAGLKGSTSSSDFIFPYTGTYMYSAIELDNFSSDGIKFYTGGSASRTAGASATKNERMRVDSNGGLRIGATTNYVSTNEKLTIQGGSSSAFDALIVMRSGFATGANTVNGVYFQNSTGGLAGYIAWNGSTTAYNTTSDYRLKENVTDMTGATERLKQLNPVRFNFIADADTTVDGFLAHEVQDVVPEAITGTKDAMRDEEYEVTPAVLDDDGNEITPAVMGTRSVPDYQGIDQSKLVPLLVATIQELEARIAALETA